MIFLFPKYWVKTRIRELQAKIPSIIPAGSINIMRAMVITQFMTDRASSHIRFFYNPAAPMILTVP